MNVQLLAAAHARSGDKGNRVNIGLIARHPSLYETLCREVTAAQVKRHFGSMCRGSVDRYEMPNIAALNFVLHDALDGGGTVTLRLDAQGKTFGCHLLRMEIEVPEKLAAHLADPTIPS